MDEFRLKALERRFHGIPQVMFDRALRIGKPPTAGGYPATLQSAIRVLIRATELYLTDRGVKVIHASSGVLTF